MPDGVSGSLHPNRELPESKQTRAMVGFLLVVTAVIVLIITVGGWDKLEGAKAVPLFYVVIFLLFAYYVSRWNRGVLPVASALAIFLIIFGGLAALAWFDRDKTGFDDPALGSSLLGFLCLLLIPLSVLLIAFSMRGFRQGWNIEAGSRAAMEAEARSV
jgi:hypothetical protein